MSEEVGRVAWVLNLDAEAELAAGEGYRRSARMAHHLRDLAGRLEALVRPGDVVLGAQALGEARGLPGRAWCPTPAALRILREAGAVVPEAPGEAVLRRVNGRAFAFPLGAGELPGARLWLPGEPPPPGGPGAWVLKRELGFAGRGMRRVALPLDGAAGRWLEARWEEGDPVVLEPWVTRTLDLGLHGWVTRGGEVRLGEPTAQDCDEAGRWRGTRRLGAAELPDAQREALVAAGGRVGAALAAAAYHGPFGVDAYRWRDGDGTRLRAIGEVNARFSMGWAIGTGEAGRAWVLGAP